MPRADSIDQLRILLIQIRTRHPVIEEERAAFRERTGLRMAQFVFANPIMQPLTLDLLDDVDAVMIGGAGAYSVTQTYDWTKDLIHLCRTCADRDLPVFGSCWGHQFLARAFGGEVVHDSSRSEIGTHEVSLTEAAVSDSLFGDLPPRFLAQMGHHDRVHTLPEGATELAVSDVAPIQAFTIDGTRIYGTQFHSEIDVARLRSRLLAYRSFYPEMQDDDIFNAIYESARETPVADALLRRFLERVVLGQAA